MPTTHPIITEADVRKVARLARLALDEAAIERHAKSLTHILEMIDHISEQDTQSVKAMSSSLDMKLGLRDDQAITTDQRTQLQALAPDTESGFYVVPPVIE